MDSRDSKLVRYVGDVLQPRTWLDVGAGDGGVSVRLKAVLPSSTYECIDVKPAPGVSKFNGRVLPEGSWDMILFNFVLHHAAFNARPLIQEALQKGKVVVIQEDIIDGSEEIAAAHFWHDPRGIFRTEAQWIALFAEWGGALQYRVRRGRAESTNQDGYHVPQALLVFQKGEA